MMPANDFPISSWPADAGDAQAASHHAPGFASLVLRLRLALRRDPDPRKRELVEQILTAAAESEQRLVEQAARIHELQAVSSTDELTGLPNRRAFEAFMLAELARARREERGGCLAFLDLDRFKAINDRHGHAAGDAVLRQIALRLQPAARATDCLARLHGDEFVLAMPGASLAQAEARLAELTTRIERQPLRHGDALIPAGLSYGFATYDGDTDLQSLLRDSDRAMYARKQARRQPETSR
ncbi:GGDEF domain-containing protein [Ferrovibrio sp.]|uniref:GGDEF domain-containing protein n=1 Tax=Ferrovibrio sp. TaxID=1917215 RepID=UPI00261F28E5|nr:GGDEF domain-containing protein [Ferrovibrio sp.]